MNKIIFILVAMLTSTTLLAAGGTDCQVDNDDIIITANLVNARFPGAPVAMGQVQVSVKEHLSTPWTFDGQKDQVGWWHTDKVINFSYYTEIDEPYETAYLVIKTNIIADQATSIGSYEFHQNGHLVSAGSITCTFE